MHFHSWREKGEKRELGLREDQGFGGRSSIYDFQVIKKKKEGLVLKNQEIQR